MNYSTALAILIRDWTILPYSRCNVDFDWRLNNSTSPALYRRLEFATNFLLPSH